MSSTPRRVAQPRPSCRRPARTPSTSILSRCSAAWRRRCLPRGFTPCAIPACWPPRASGAGRSSRHPRCRRPSRRLRLPHAGHPSRGVGCSGARLQRSWTGNRTSSARRRPESGERRARSLYRAAPVPRDRPVFESVTASPPAETGPAAVFGPPETVGAQTQRGFCLTYARRAARAYSTWSYVPE